MEHQRARDTALYEFGFDEEAERAAAAVEDAATPTPEPESVPAMSDSLRPKDYGLAVAEAAPAPDVKPLRKSATYDEVFNSLPAVANPAIEMEWVGSHPAMSRKTRGKEKDGVVVTAPDIRTAPSKRAANMLVIWSVKPAEFYKQVLSEHKKKENSESGSRDVERDLGLDEVKRYLESI